MSSTLDVSQFPKGCLNLLALKNIAFIVVTLDVFQLLMFWLKFPLENMYDMSVTLEVSQLLIQSRRTFVPLNVYDITVM